MLEYRALGRSSGQRRQARATEKIRETRHPGVQSRGRDSSKVAETTPCAQFLELCLAQTVVGSLMNKQTNGVIGFTCLTGTRYLCQSESHLEGEEEDTMQEWAYNLVWGSDPVFR